MVSGLSRFLRRAPPPRPRLAIVDNWPNLRDSAEREFIARFIRACENLGIECAGAVTSDDLEKLQPDAVILTHEYGCKLTRFPTIAAIWSPQSFFEGDTYRERSIRSCDGYLAGSTELRHFLDDGQHGLGVRKPVAREIFLPTTYRTPHDALAKVPEPSLAYVGIHWDGDRHGLLFEILAERGLVHCYGPAASWSHIGNAYAGPLPFDGRSVQDMLARHGVALCLHHREHRTRNVPSMRIFETLSVGALVICDDIPFAREFLSDIALFVDTRKSMHALADQVAAHLDWIRSHPDDARQRAARGKAWFDECWSLETKIEHVLLPLLDEVKAAGAPALAGTADCDIVFPIDTGEIAALEATLSSIAAAKSPGLDLRIVMVASKAAAHRVEMLAKSARRLGLSVRKVEAPPGPGSTSLWAGLQAAKAPFVALADPAGTVFPHHYRHLVATLLARTEAPAAIATTLDQCRDGEFADAPNFEGPLGRTIAERRAVTVNASFDLRALARFDDAVAANSWVARTEILRSVLGRDPEVDRHYVAYLLLLAASRGPLAPSGSVTAVRFGAPRDQAAVGRDPVARRLRRRISRLTFPYATTIGQLTAAGEPQPVATDDAPPPGTVTPLDFGDSAHGGPALQEHAALTGFLSPEQQGAWSRQTTAIAEIALAAEAASAGGWLALEIMAAHDDTGARVIDVELPERHALRLEAVDWTWHRIIVPFAPSARGNLPIRLTVDRLRAITGGDKHPHGIGLCLRSVALARQPEDFPDLTREIPSHSFSSYEQGDFAQVEVKFSYSNNICTSLKMQRIENNYSIEFDMGDMWPDERIDSDYVEFQSNPIYRIYFNGDDHDMARREGLLPERLRNLMLRVRDFPARSLTPERTRLPPPLLNLLRESQARIAALLPPLGH
ncbi:glycosyltransferase family protein [Zavarzinia compransoris]|uniref:Spore protein YkvP/CgeB glycosyl transferase-like domain-containing protein n=1 Tax=Zavarzinia compransoris TaxID=1264899 RepID=A0A317E0D1_9PROT|nr:glycosyltransferase [Zavarzinia compransoris]PWR19560.1 hypothetical protein DKG75_13870 [Zavarzinia compransoris]TDP40902.1 hypothetical protein DES42_11347 [Zavarzinia compransoris]